MPDTLTLEIPASHRDLLTRAVPGVLTTMLADGQPQSTLVWVDYDGECACVNTTRRRQKGQNLEANPRVCLLVVDPVDTSRYLQIRGDAELVEQGALEQLDRLTRKYTSHPRYYGYVYPLKQQLRETRVICRIHARAITCDAIHRADRAERWGPTWVASALGRARAGSRSPGPCQPLTRSR